ncbi:drug/metabolite transporter (DMT)-like permease [Dysgonomonas sp. PFB1-18]|nr:drug/metabolite transporter (DMT)-like permease [Dysgonomonas sp. PF1-14]MDH6340393.1 drug/metabolite transporter (DMT)-like permease [Dysgonomonas sp. PF1-16]MDH6382027.1 drug/metabolite transporter (DMT)-like permease [Dysgonomonas sp. PFB1-18]MDH6399364.1 drug/metabolite transporter (DMT)-like permease [Dysgonomonas sp. PF1-23]
MIPNVNKIKALLAIVLSTTIIGLSYVFIKNGLKWGSPLDLLSDRLAISGLLLLIFRYSGFIKIDKIDRNVKYKLIGVSSSFPTKPTLGFFLQICEKQRFQYPDNIYIVAEL